jgi:hypothetical protein
MEEGDKWTPVPLVEALVDLEDDTTFNPDTASNIEWFGPANEDAAGKYWRSVRNQKAHDVHVEHWNTTVHDKCDLRWSEQERRQQEQEEARRWKE